MDFAIEKRKRNDLLSRDEVTAILKSESTPKTEEVKSAFADKLDKNAELIIIRRIKGSFGSQDFSAEAYAYDNPDALKKFDSGMKRGKAEPEKLQEKEEEKKEEKKDDKEG